MGQSSCPAQQVEGAVAVLNGVTFTELTSPSFPTNSRLASPFWNVRFGAGVTVYVDYEALSSRLDCILNAGQNGGLRMTRSSGGKVV
jgi:hypothetical protein